MKKITVAIYITMYFLLAQITMFGVLNHWIIPDFWKINLFGVLSVGWIPIVSMVINWEDLK